MCDSTREIFVAPQETPFLLSITEYLENTTVDQPADDSQSIIHDIQIEKEQLHKEIHQVTTLKEILSRSGVIGTSNQRSRGKEYSQ